MREVSLTSPLAPTVISHEAGAKCKRCGGTIKTIWYSYQLCPRCLPISRPRIAGYVEDEEAEDG